MRRCVMEYNRGILVAAGCGVQERLISLVLGVTDCLYSLEFGATSTRASTTHSEEFKIRTIIFHHPVYLQSTIANSNTSKWHLYRPKKLKKSLTTLEETLAPNLGPRWH